MKKTTKNSTRKASHKKAVKDLAVKPAKGRTVRGGISDIVITKATDSNSTKMLKES